jgi:hypothetical protein
MSLQRVPRRDCQLRRARCPTLHRYPHEYSFHIKCFRRTVYRRSPKKVWQAGLCQDAGVGLIGLCFGNDADNLRIWIFIILLIKASGMLEFKDLTNE